MYTNIWKFDALRKKTYFKEVEIDMLTARWLAYPIMFFHIAVDFRGNSATEDNDVITIDGQNKQAR